MNPQEANELKQQLFQQIKDWPEEKKNPIIDQINSMSIEQFEEFLRQNKMIQSENRGEIEEPRPKGPQCIFCQIAQGLIPSSKLDENKESIAVLEINPLSKGHTLIIPKKHLKEAEIPTSAFTLAKKVEKRINSKLKPKEIKISTQTIMSHGVIEVLPLYGTEKERKKATEKDLAELKSLLESKKRPKREKKPKQTNTIPSHLPKVKSRTPY